MRHIKTYKIFESNLDIKIDEDYVYDIFIPIMRFGLEVYKCGVDEFAAPSIGGFDGIYIKLKNIDLERRLSNELFNEIEESINHFESKYNCKFICFKFKLDGVRAPIRDVYSVQDLDKFLINEIAYLSDISFITLIFKF